MVWHVPQQYRDGAVWPRCDGSAGSSRLLRRAGPCSAGAAATVRQLG